MGDQRSNLSYTDEISIHSTNFQSTKISKIHKFLQYKDLICNETRWITIKCVSAVDSLLYTYVINNPIWDVIQTCCKL